MATTLRMEISDVREIADEAHDVALETRTELRSLLAGHDKKLDAAVASTTKTNVNVSAAAKEAREARLSDLAAKERAEKRAFWAQIVTIFVPVLAILATAVGAYMKGTQDNEARRIQAGDVPHLAPPPPPAPIKNMMPPASPAPLPSPSTSASASKL